MRLLAIGACLCTIGVLASHAQADNYGGVSAQYREQMIRYTHAWFDQLGVADRMIGVECHESGFNPRAVNWAGPVAGLLQIRYPTWTANNSAVSWYIKKFWHYRAVSLTEFVQRLSDPVQSLRLGFLIYKYHGDQWGGTC